MAISYCSRNVSFNFPSTSGVEDFVDDAVVTHADPTQADKLALQDTSPERTLSQVVDRADDSAALRLRNASEFPGGAPLDPNRVAHP